MSSPAPQSRTDVITDFRRSQLLDAARIAFARLGLAGTTVDEIARSAGVAKGTVYLYFKSKDDIVCQVIDADLAELASVTIGAVGQPGTLEDRVVGFMAAYVGFFEHHRAFFDLIQFEMGRDALRTTLQKAEAVFQQQLAAWRHVLEDEQQAGRLGDVDLDLAALSIVGLAGGLGRQRLRGWTSGPIDELARGAGRTLVRGLIR